MRALSITTSWVRDSKQKELKGNQIHDKTAASFQFEQMNVWAEMMFKVGRTGRVFGSARAFLGSARVDLRHSRSRACFSGPWWAESSSGSARASLLARDFFLRI
jgi:hypothetical protein